VRAAARLKLNKEKKIMSLVVAFIVSGSTVRDTGEMCAVDENFNVIGKINVTFNPPMPVVERRNRVRNAFVEFDKQCCDYAKCHSLRVFRVEDHTNRLRDYGYLHTTFSITSLQQGFLMGIQETDESLDFIRDDYADYIEQRYETPPRPKRGEYTPERAFDIAFDAQVLLNISQSRIKLKQRTHKTRKHK
jgi:hypothetical protein